jgi:hypothetical protein
MDLLLRLLYVAYATAHFLKKMLFQLYDYSVVGTQHIFIVSLSKADHPIESPKMDVLSVSQQVIHKPETNRQYLKMVL